MRGSSKTTWAILVTICLTVADAQACGELMLRSLGGMRYHAFVTRHPAEILLYSRDTTGGSKRPTASDAKFHDSLEIVGHKVTMVRGSDELGQALAARKYDVIIGYAADMVAATSQIAKASREPKLIPVLDTESNERQMRERFPFLVTGNFNDLLRTIEQAMKALRA